MSLAQRLNRSSRPAQTSPAESLGPVGQRLYAAIGEMGARAAEHPMGALFTQLIPVFTLELRKVPDESLRAGLLTMSDQLRAIATGVSELAPTAGPQTLGGEGMAAGPDGTPGPAATP